MHIPFSSQAPLNVTQTCQSQPKADNFFFKMLDSECSQRGPLIYTCDSISNLITVDHPLCYPVTPVTFLLHFIKIMCYFEGNLCTKDTLIIPAPFPVDPSQLNPVTKVTIYATHNAMINLITKDLSCFLPVTQVTRIQNLGKNLVLLLGQALCALFLHSPSQAFCLLLPHMLAQSQQSLVHHSCT